jgi:hypothetical protein
MILRKEAPEDSLPSVEDYRAAIAERASAHAGAAWSQGGARGGARRLPGGVLM